jgi:hypothetical protein
MILHVPGGPRTAPPATPIIQPACDGALPTDGTAVNQGSVPTPTALTVLHAIEISSPGYP